MRQEEKILIDKYLANSLTGIELKEFLDRMETNDKFREEVSFQNILMEGIQYAEEKRLIASVEEVISYRKPFVPFALKLIFTFLIITTGGIVLWNYIDPGTSGNKHNYFSLDYFKNNNSDSSRVGAKDNTKSVNRKKQINKLTLHTDSTSEKGKNILSSATISNQSDSTEIVVKKDQKLISITLKSVNLSGPSSEVDKTESSISKSTVEKLNPSGGLPDIVDDTNDFYNVEFWVSPVNYKGYKLINNKLILFGIEEPDAVQLFSKADNLWMKYGQDFYSILPTDEFESLIKTNEIISELK